MKERPILFTGEMVRAILDGRKTQTRRVIKGRRIYPDAVYEGFIDGQHQWYESRDGIVYRRNCPYGVPGDRLWVRETWRIMSMPEDPIRFQYRADMSIGEEDDYDACDWAYDRYERWYERQAQKVQEDCDKAGLPNDEHAVGYNWIVETCPTRWQPSIHLPKFASRIRLEITGVRAERLQGISAVEATIAEGYRLRDDGVGPVDWFITLWDSINAKRDYGWDANPWVWVVEFSPIAGMELDDE